MLTSILAFVITIEGVLIFLLYRTVKKLWDRRLQSDELMHVEERILELMGRFKKLADNKIDSLNTKVKQIKDLIREANNLLSALHVAISEAEQTFEKVSELPSNVTETLEASTERTEQLENAEREEEPSVEKQIMLLKAQGLSEVEIARTLGIGVGEVKLILELFGRKSGVRS